MNKYVKQLLRLPVAITIIIGTNALVRVPLLLLIISLVLVSCVLLKLPSVKPVHAQQRLNSFPTNNLPLQQQAVIYWNNYQVPFIEAQTDRDCAFLLGMVHAHLRLGQIALYSRLASHRAGELAGPFTTKIDQTIASLQLDKALPQIEANLPDSTKMWVSAYVDGLNYYQDHMPAPPPEFALLNIKPEPFTVKDVLLFTRLMGVDVSWMNWVGWLRERNKPYGNELFERLVKLGLANTPSFGPDHPALNTMATAMRTGSNAWALRPSRTADGSTIMATDPHLGLMLPSTWLAAGWKCPSYHTVGLMFPGAPVMILGRNRQIAWSATNMRCSSSDLYAVDSSAVTSQTQVKLKQRWWFNNKATIRQTDLGPIISDKGLFANDSLTLALKWVGHNPSDEISAFLKLNKATNWQEFVNAFSTYAVSGQNYVYADASGNIGLLPGVAIPNRHYTTPPDYILPAKEPWLWNEVIPPTKLPNVYNPESGFVASANNIPVHTNPPLGWFFSPDDRVKRLNTLLGQGQPLSMDDVKKVQQDTCIPRSQQLAQALAAKLQLLNASDNQQYINQLVTWDGSYPANSRPALLYQLLLYHLTLDYYTQRYDADVAKGLLSQTHLESLLLEDLDDQVLTNCLPNCLTKAKQDAQKYKVWGDIHRLRLGSALSNLPLVGKRYQVTNLPASGSINSLAKTSHRVANTEHNSTYGANARLIMRLNNPDDNYYVLMGGQDGWLGSDNFADQVPLWQQGSYLQLPLTLDKVKENCQTKMEFEPTQ